MTATFPQQTSFGPANVATAGGTLIRPEWMEVIITDILNEPGVLVQLNIKRLPAGNTATFPVYKHGATVGEVGELGSIPVTQVATDQLTVTLAKHAAITAASTEEIEDINTGADLEALMGQDMDVQTKLRIAGCVIGLQNGTPMATTGTGLNVVHGPYNWSLVDSMLVNAPIYLDAYPSTQPGATGRAEDAIRFAVSDAAAVLTELGHRPTGIVYSLDVERYVRNARSALDSTRPIFTSIDDIAAGVPSKSGGPVLSTVTQHLNALATADGVVAIIGDFTKLQCFLREDIRVLETNVAQVSEELNLFLQDGIAWRFITRFGQNCYERDAFVCIKANAPGNTAGVGGTDDTNA